MVATPARQTHVDEGAVLVLVLVFVVVIGLLSVALLEESRAGVITTSTVTRNQARVAAVNGGVDAAIQSLRTDPTLCGAPGSTSTLAPLTLNNQAVTVSCTSRPDGSSAGADGWALFLNQTTSVFRTQGNPNDDRLISGPVYNAGTYPASWDLSANVIVTNGGVLQRGATACPSSPLPSRLTVSSPAPGLYAYCTGPGPSLPPPSQALDALWPGAVLPATALASTTTGSGSNQCRRFSPGRYTSAPIISPSGVNYFRNGVYFLDNVDNWQVGGWVLGGLPGPGETRQSAIPSTCNSGDSSSGALSTGVVFVLGGNSRISLSSGDRMELHSPRLAAQPDLTGVSIYTVPSGLPASSPFRSSVSTVSGTTPILQVSNNGSTSCAAGGNGGQANGSQLVVHGNVYAPDKCIVAGIMGTGAMAMLRGGVVAGSLELRSSASVSNTGFISNGATSGQRTVVITATSAAGVNSKAISATAVVSIANDSNRTVNIASWVIDNP